GEKSGGAWRLQLRSCWELAREPLFFLLTRAQRRPKSRALRLQSKEQSSRNFDRNKRLRRLCTQRSIPFTFRFAIYEARDGMAENQDAPSLFRRQAEQEARWRQTN